MNVIRQFGHKAAPRRVGVTSMTRPMQRKVFATPMNICNRPVRSIGTMSRITKTSNKPSSFQLTAIQKRRMTSVLGSSVMATFVKSSYLMWGIPLFAMLEPYINTLPFDAFYGTVMPYHTYHGLMHIFTDYLPGYAWVAYVVAGVMFVGIQNANFNGEGVSKSVRRLFVSRKLPIDGKEQA